jgi:hypothetical protein
MPLIANSSSELDDLNSSDLPSGVHRALFDLWHAKSSPGRLPARSRFDPIEMPDLLPHLVLFDVQRDPLRFRIRLVGTAVVEAMGVDTTGRYLDELGRINDVHRRTETIATTGKPYFKQNLPLTWTHLDFKKYSVLGVPLANDGQTIDKLLYTMLFE